MRYIYMRSRHSTRFRRVVKYIAFTDEEKFNILKGNGEEVTDEVDESEEGEGGEETEETTAKKSGKSAYPATKALVK